MSDTRHTPPHDADKDGETFVRRLGESAQQIWLAGLGAFTKAQAEGSRLFETLVNEGRQYEKRHHGEDGAGFRENVESTLGQARERTQRTWDKVEQAFDDQVQGVLRRLNVPCRQDITELEQQLVSLRQRLGELEGQFARHQVRCTCGTGTPSSPPTGDLPGAAPTIITGE